MLWTLYLNILILYIPFWVVPLKSINRLNFIILYYVFRFSENAFSFTCGWVTRFCALNSFKPVRRSPYHLSSNRVAEGAGQTIKKGLKKKKRLQTILKLDYFESLPETVFFPINNGLFLINVVNCWLPQSRLDELYQDLSVPVTTKENDSKISTDKRFLWRIFHIGDVVSVVNFQGKTKWLFEVFDKLIGPLTVWTLRMQLCY